MGYWTNRAISAFLRTKPVPKTQGLPIGLLYPVAVPTLASIRSCIRRVAWISNVKGVDPRDHFERVAAETSVRVIAQIYPVLVVLIYATPFFILVGNLFANPDSMSARYAIGDLADTWPLYVFGCLAAHVLFRWVLIWFHAKSIAVKFGSAGKSKTA